ncbi:MAG: DNA methylase [Nitrospirae bacterium GWC2_46_6]|nr:MAG: DNA methylase [Nitrospirae bacterium GWC2_46_6]OGW21139.1 MAG: DNA methylase [Nitrospirae bacterium GWA2_46_11]OGW23816.1 MAG: DNA methylase [Nitrospirae bacterium GWB2_47_37]HAK88478.1 DNA modification methylase [Nitrospiraceae bacterium]
MIKTVDIVKGFKTPEARWARFGPYYAMFPLDFAFEVVEKYSKKGDFIIDPFAGRCSSIYAGGVLGRQSLGIEINPVGWLYGSVKLRPADKKFVIKRLEDIFSRRNYYKRASELMPVFYKMCYCDEVLKFLLAARKYLDWRNDNVDATLMSILLVYLHGKLGEGLSNQMRMTKAMGINYSVNWWGKHNMIKPPRINPLEFILKKIEWRYEKGTPNVQESHVIFGDSTIELEQIVQKAKRVGMKFSLLFTSPPYCSVTDYHADQWLRLWLLGGPQSPKSLQGQYKSRFVSKEDYYNLIDIVFGKCADIMDSKSTIYVRTDAREFTLNSTCEILLKYFPDHIVKIVPKPFKNRTQTEICGNKTKNIGEVDIILMKK